MAQATDPSLTAGGGLRNQFAYTIETAAGATIGASVSGPIAFAMYRASLDEFFSQSVTLRRDGEILASTY
jgi:hypothetical protein